MSGWKRPVGNRALIGSTTPASVRTATSWCTTSGTAQKASKRSGQVLMPILAEVGVDPGELAVMPVHKLDQTSRSE